MRIQNTPASINADLLLAIRDATIPDIDPIHIPDKWVASSLLQKAIRRGQSSYALAAANFLHRLDSRIVWRRLSLIGWEDISFGDVEACCAASELARNKRLRTKLGGDWRTAVWVIVRFCNVAKNRITDDLVTVLEHARTSPALINQVAAISKSQLRGLVRSNDRCILRRAAVTWLMCGTDKFPSEAMPLRSGDLGEAFALFDQAPLPSSLSNIGVPASKATKTIFPSLVAMLWQDWADCDLSDPPIEDCLNWNTPIGDIPAYAYDGHTAKGSRYLRKLSRLDADLALWLFEWLPAEQHVPMLKKFAFRSVASLCNQRHSWGDIEEVRTLADGVGFQLERRVFAEGMKLFHAASSQFPIEEIG